jgi:AhpD family alkylhydroperoxidase
VDPLYLDKSNPDLYAALITAARGVSAAATSAGISPGLVELLCVRVSQINGCAYCLDLHTRRAVDAGESPQRLAVLDAWHETELFDEAERAALEWAETVTTLPGAEERLAIEYRVRESLSDAEFAAVSWLAVTMNAANRLSIASRHPVRPRR